MVEVNVSASGLRESVPAARRPDFTVDWASYPNTLENSPDFYLRRAPGKKAAVPIYRVLLWPGPEADSRSQKHSKNCLLLRIFAAAHGRDNLQDKCGTRLSV